MTIYIGSTAITGRGGGGSVDIDNLSITENTNNEIQTVGIINSNDSTVAVKTWAGTLAEYNAIATKDPNTLYNITDDSTGGESVYTKAEVNGLVSTSISTLLSGLYPVGSIYIGTQATCPLSTIIAGSTWELVSSGRSLQGADSSHSAGSTIEAGLPNITGTVSRSFSCADSSGATIPAGTGAFAGTSSVTPGKNATSSGSWWTDNRTLNFNASRSSSIYGNSTTVQPNAYVVNIWKRVA